jgi:hypothetical protein
MQPKTKMGDSQAGQAIGPQHDRAIHQRQSRPSPVRSLGRSFARIAHLSPILLAAACASIVSDDDTTTYIATEPENARCELQGDGFNRVVNTPASLSLPSDAAPITVVCGAEGFRQTSKDMDTSADGWILGNLIFGGLVGVAIDAARGAGQKFPAELTVVLEPESFESLAARDAWYDTRGREIDEEWDGVLKTIDNECNRNMKELCAEKKDDAEKTRAEELEALEQRRSTAVVGEPDANAGPQTLNGSESGTEEPARGAAVGSVRHRAGCQSHARDLGANTSLRRNLDGNGCDRQSLVQSRSGEPIQPDPHCRERPDPWRRPGRQIRRQRESRRRWPARRGVPEQLSVYGRIDLERRAAPS